MEKTGFNSKFRAYARTLSPTKEERDFVTKVYDSFCATLEEEKCLIIGSYARYTTVRPLHDLDILYTLGEWDEQNHPNVQELLQDTAKKIKDEYTEHNPTDYDIEVVLQTHSVTVIFRKNDDEIFSVDVVPGYTLSKNEFEQDTYKIPEKGNKDTNWIATDPRGYIKIAERINDLNPDFRKAVKIIKSWKASCKKKEQDFGLKSFHIEQIVLEYFQESHDLEIFDAVFKFFVDLNENIESPKIKDRADKNRYIDEYLNDLSDKQKGLIKQARDCFLIKMEDFSENNSVEELVEGCFYNRAGAKEEFLFDKKIPVLIEPSLRFEIDGIIQNSFKGDTLRNREKIPLKRTIKFSITRNITKDYTMWKVQNDKKSKEVLDAKCTRGEITKDQTLQNPETTTYQGKHYVECYAILNGACIARSKISVDIKREL